MEDIEMELPHRSRAEGRLSITHWSHQGGREYMEDRCSFGWGPPMSFEEARKRDKLDYHFYGVFDGHGGPEAAIFAQHNLQQHIESQREFLSEDDEEVCTAIRKGFVSVHEEMKRELDSWPKTFTGHPSTAGTTASIAFIKNGKVYIGHVGDSAIVMGYQDSPNKREWKAGWLTKSHKPYDPEELAGIQERGGKVVMCKGGIHRVVWKQPSIENNGPILRSTKIIERPFLAIARSLGDFWSYESECGQYAVSPEPQTNFFNIDVTTQRCLIFASDGLWDVMSHEEAVKIVQKAVEDNTGQTPSEQLGKIAMTRWYERYRKADNITVLTVLIYPPGSKEVDCTAEPEPNVTITEIPVEDLSLDSSDMEISVTTDINVDICPTPTVDYTLSKLPLNRTNQESVRKNLVTLLNVFNIPSSSNPLEMSKNPSVKSSNKPPSNSQELGCILPNDRVDEPRTPIILSPALSNPNDVSQSNLSVDLNFTENDTEMKDESVDENLQKEDTTENFSPNLNEDLSRRSRCTTRRKTRKSSKKKKRAKITKIKIKMTLELKSINESTSSIQTRRVTRLSARKAESVSRSLRSSLDECPSEIPQIQDNLSAPPSSAIRSRTRRNSTPSRKLLEAEESVVLLSLNKRRSSRAKAK